MKSLQTEKVEEQSVGLSGSLIEILDANIEVLTHRNIKSLVKQWSNNGADQDQYKNAICYFYLAINSSRDEFIATFEDARKECENDSDMQMSYRILNATSQHSTGNIDSRDLLYKQCAQVSDLATNPKRMQLIGEYLKNAADSYLKENYSEMYEEIKNERDLELRGFEMNVANDDVATSPSPSTKSTAATSQLYNPSSALEK